MGNALGGDSGGYAASTVSSLIYMNGTTDYLEVYFYNDGSSITVSDTVLPYVSYFSGAMVRSA